MNFKKIALPVAVALTLSLGLMACSPSVEEDNEQNQNNQPSQSATNISVAHVFAPSHPVTLASEEFKKAVEAELPGRFNVEVASNGALGGEMELVEMLQDGSLAIAVVTTGTLGQVVPEFNVFDQPYLIRDAAAADKLLDGEIGTELLAEFQNHGMRGLAWWENGIRQLSANKEIRHPEDMQDITIRTMQNELHMEYHRLAGANPTPLAFTQLYQALSDGSFDAQENPLANIAASKLYEVQDYVIAFDYVYSPIVFLVSNVFWNTLTEEEQDVIANQAHELRIYQRNENREQQSEYIQQIEDGGSTYITLSDEEKEPWIELARELHPRTIEMVGEDFFNRVLAEGGW